MAKILILLAVLAAAAADPLVLTSPYLASPLVTQYAAPYAAPYAASYAAPYAASYAAPYAAPYTSAALVAPPGGVPTGVPTVPAVSPAVPAAVPAAVPLSSVSAYSYGSSYSIQDYTPLVNTAAAPLYSSAYSVPYSFADWFYRR